LGREWRGDRAVRDVPEYIRFWARLVQGHRVPLDAVFLPRPLVSLPLSPCSTLHVKKVVGPGGVSKTATNPQKAREAYWNQIRDWEENGAGDGERHEALKELVFAWRLPMRLDSAAVHASDLELLA
jgi:hypothetical protein